MHMLKVSTVQKTPIIEHVLNWAKFKADQDLKKTDGKSKRNRYDSGPDLFWRDYKC
jgi:DNA topoisomerase-2